jgi:cyclophilin family peptidyl-prolyl cis-trans isomerase
MHLARIALLGLALASLAVACWLTGCGGKSDTASADATSGESATEVDPTSSVAGPAPKTKAPEQPVDPVVVLHTSAGDIKLQLYAEKAPQTVANFLRNYVERGFYEQTIFHHVEPGMMLIGGGFTADLQPKPTKAPIYNESRNGLQNKKGTIAMIHEPNAAHSATSQFFVNLQDNPDLDFQAGEEADVFGYCVFGKVVEGLDVVERIAGQPTTAQGDFVSIPVETVMIERVEELR